MTRVLIADADDPVMRHLKTFLSWSQASVDERADFSAFFARTDSADEARRLAGLHDGRFEVSNLDGGSMRGSCVVTRRRQIRSGGAVPMRIVVFGSRTWIVEDSLRAAIPVSSIDRPSLRATASHAVSLIDLACRRLDWVSDTALDALRDTDPVRYRWVGDLPPALDTAAVGLVGAGEVALEVARMLRPRVAQLFYWSRRRLSSELENATGLEWCSSDDELFERCQIVSIHTLGDQVISRDRLSDLRRCSVMVNTARATSWDEGAAIEAVQARRLTVGVDCISTRAWGQFTRADGVILTPHVAGDSLSRVAHEFEQVARECAADDEAIDRQRRPYGP